ncbi:hypothetical protein GCM10011579_033570 [Streptomyces albiflavescens]|uniref:Uncharacterized protein n=1 Tax=Streptomyces albiflavescens TaxID=1623582 RepID=A0A918D450_9ACTN|nr:hypothetical protein GCM10011579_033570 [Streptomyces albiflavescens]
MPAIPIETVWDVTLRRGNVLAFENTRGGSAPRAVEFYETRYDAEPYVPRKVALPDDQPTGTPETSPTNASRQRTR